MSDSETEERAMRVNGKVAVEAATSVAELLRRHGVDPQIRFLAVAVNGGVVPRREWATAELRPGDEVEIVRPFAGG